jgi:hypothetical protein
LNYLKKCGTVNVCIGTQVLSGPKVMLLTDGLRIPRMTEAALLFADYIWCPINLARMCTLLLGKMMKKFKEDKPLQIVSSFKCIFFHVGRTVTAVHPLHYPLSNITVMLLC